MAPSPSIDGGSKGQEAIFTREHEVLLAEIEAEFRATAAWTGRAAPSARVREAMAGVPRHAFVPEAERAFAYVNHALPIGCGQTISQPFIVAMMTDLLKPGPGDVVLEVGTGSGYQAAVLSRLVERVYTAEVVPELARRAAAVLARLGFDNVEVRTGDGALGWPAHAPFDKVIVTAEAATVPKALIDQLKPGGRLLMPVGDTRSQQLTLLTKQPEGATEQHALLPVAFVPLVAGR